jgi:uncharacterized protein (TIGR04222 family)
VDRYPIETWVAWPLFVALVVTSVAGYAWVRRASVPAGAPAVPPSPTRTEIALLRGLPARPVIAALAWLRGHGAIEATEHGTIVVLSPPPSGALPLDAAVHRAVATVGRWDGIEQDAAVAAAVDEATRTVRAAGWWADNDDPRLRPRALITVAAVLVEIAVFMTIGGTPLVATGICLLFPLVTLLPFLLSRDGHTPAGRRVVRRAFRAARRLPKHDPDRLALEVALHGMIALRATFPRLVTDGRVYERRPENDLN